MHSYTAWFVKELREGARRYRFLALGAAFFFFAFLDPLMLRFLPAIIKAQMGADPGILFPATRDYAYGTFLGDLYEIGSLVVCIALGGTFARERAGFVIPVSKGASWRGIVLAKLSVYAFFLAALSMAASMVSWVYAGLIFPGPGVGSWIPVIAGANMSLYFAWLAATVLFASSFAPASGAVAAGVMAAYGLPALGGLIGWASYLPSYLATGSAKVAPLAAGGFAIPSLTAVFCIVLCSEGAVRVMRSTEL